MLFTCEDYVNITFILKTLTALYIHNVFNCMAGRKLGD